MYTINVSLNGHWFFRTDEDSNATRVKMVFIDLKEKFKQEDGYLVTMRCKENLERPVILDKEGNLEILK